MKSQIKSATEAMTFLQAGKAIVTLVSTATGTRYTYKVNESEDGKLFFVSVLFGPENTTDYMYIGIIRDGLVKWTPKSRVKETDKRWVAFKWTYENLSAGRIPEGLEVWHEGKCGRCSRTLTVPESIANGIGPECAKRTGLASLAAAWTTK